MEKLPPQFNLLENIRNKTSKNSLQRFETYNSDLLHYLLDIKRENLNFTKLFLEYLQNEKKLKFDFDLNKINYKNIKVDKEYFFKDLFWYYKIIFFLKITKKFYFNF